MDVAQVSQLGLPPGTTGTFNAEGKYVLPRKERKPKAIVKMQRETQTENEDSLSQETQTVNEPGLAQETQTPGAGEYSTEAAVQTASPPELLDSQSQTNLVETTDNSVQVRSLVKESDTQTKALELVGKETQVEEVVTSEQET